MALDRRDARSPAVHRGALLGAGVDLRADRLLPGHLRRRLARAVDGGVHHQSDAGEVCRTYTRAAPPPSGSPITCAASGPAFSEPRVGRAVAAGCWDTVSPGVYATTQTARIGGFTVSPAGAGGRLVIDTGAKRVRATGPMRAPIDGHARRAARLGSRDCRSPARRSLPRSALPSLAGGPLGAGNRVEWTSDGQGAKLKADVAGERAGGAPRPRRPAHRARQAAQGRRLADAEARQPRGVLGRRGGGQAVRPRVPDAVPAAGAQVGLGAARAAGSERARAAVAPRGSARDPDRVRPAAGGGGVVP